MENINSWQDIQWSTIEKIVFRLQLRIYKAATNQELGKVHKLQKLLISSKSAKYLSVRKVTQDKAGKLISSPTERFALANQLTLNGNIPKTPTRRDLRICSERSEQDLVRTVNRLRIKDRAKQMLAYLALSPQWEAQFEGSSFGFRPGISVLDAMEAVFLGIAKKPKWVLDADISKCFDRINHKYLIEKCNTFSEMRKQIRAWLKAGILEEYAFPEMGGVISPLLANIALDGLGDSLDAYINTGPNNRKTLTFVRYADDFVLIYPNRNTLEGLKEVTQQFLEPIGLELDLTKTRLVHTLERTDDSPPGFSFLGFDVIQKPAFPKRKSKQNFITLITPSKEGVRRHKEKIRDTIRRHRGVDQKRLIQHLNPIIRGWALSKRTQISSKIFQDLDQYLFLHLWKWARKRHPKMSKYKLKEKYWHRVNRSNWVFGVGLQLHSKIPRENLGQLELVKFPISHRKFVVNERINSLFSLFPRSRMN